MEQFILNILGGPDAGKTTNALLVAGKMKRDRVKVEYADEWIKSKVYEKAEYPFMDQIYTFAKQRKKLLERLSEERLQIIVTDSPLIMSAIYIKYPDPIFEALVLQELKSMNNISIYLERPEDRDYDPVGRLQESKEEAVKVDKTVKEFLDKHHIPYHTVVSETGSEDQIYEIAKRYLYPEQYKDQAGVAYSIPQAIKV